MTYWREAWRHDERADDGSGYWQLARISRNLDDPEVWELETNTRGSVISTQLRLSTADAERLRDALNRELPEGPEGEGDPHDLRHLPPWAQEGRP